MKKLKYDHYDTIISTHLSRKSKYSMTKPTPMFSGYGITELDPVCWKNDADLRTIVSLSFPTLTLLPQQPELKSFLLGRLLQLLPLSQGAFDWLITA